MKNVMLGKPFVISLPVLFFTYSCYLLHIGIRIYFILSKVTVVEITYLNFMSKHLFNGFEARYKAVKRLHGEKMSFNDQTMKVVFQTPTARY